jgi:hypothetical protein
MGNIWIWFQKMRVLICCVAALSTLFFMYYSSDSSGQESDKILHRHSIKILLHILLSIIFKLNMIWFPFINSKIDETYDRHERIPRYWGTLSSRRFLSE